jgi:tripartite-type tricarboxylate transporter receptor subunit TctC
MLRKEFIMRIHWWVLPAVLAAIPAVQAAEAGSYPTRPVRMLLPQGPGSTTDTVGRIVFAATAERLGQQLVVDNRPGAGGTIGMEIASRAVPDGYTLVGVAASMMAISPHVYRKLAYDPLRDFVPIGTFILSQIAVCVHAKLPPKSVQELVKLAKDKPGSLNMSSAGIGSTSHLAGILFTTLAGISANHVPYKGGASIQAVSLGESDFTVAPLSAGMAQAKTGRLRVLATGGDKRSAIIPELPTLAESGVPGFRLYGWNGVVAPKGTSRTVVVKFNRVMNEALDSAEVRKRYLGLGEVPAIGTPEDFGKLIREDYVKFGKVVKEAGIKPE